VLSSHAGSQDGTLAADPVNPFMQNSFVENVVWTHRLFIL
jgi:hypothetical protein